MWDTDYDRRLNEPMPPPTIAMLEPLPPKERRMLAQRRAQQELERKLYEDLGRKQVNGSRRAQAHKGLATRALILERARVLKAKNPRLSAGNIAKDLGLSRSTVTRHLAKARNTL
jgi:DNA-binding transcriptional ArsR family regulator